MPQHVAIYIRVSTQEQATEGYSIAAQTDRLTSYCKARDWPVFDVYTDAGFSGSNTQRPSLRRLFSDIESGSVDCVLVYKLDRLSRSQKDTLYIIEDVFLKNHVDFVSMSENFDTSSPLGRAMIGILSVFAQLEREQIKERMAMGRMERAKDGYWHGGGRPPFGYDYINGELVPNEIESLGVKYIYREFLAGVPIHSICLGVKKKYGVTINTESTILNVLRRPLYRGLICFGGNVYPGRHPALIDEDSYKKAAVLLSDRRRIAASRPNPFRATTLLGGLLYCENCGAGYFSKGNYSGHKKTGLVYRPYYYCYSRGKTNSARILDASCKNPVYAVVDLDARIISEVRRLLNPDYFSAFVSSAHSSGPTVDAAYEKQVLMRRIDSLDLQISRVVDLYQLGTISLAEIGQRTQELQNEKHSLQTALAAVESAEAAAANDAASLLSPDAAWSILQDFDAVIASNDRNACRSILQKLIKKIIVKREPGALDILWNF